MCGFKKKFKDLYAKRKIDKWGQGDALIKYKWKTLFKPISL